MNRILLVFTFSLFLIGFGNYVFAEGEVNLVLDPIATIESCSPVHTPHISRALPGYVIFKIGLV